MLSQFGYVGTSRKFLETADATKLHSFGSALKLQVHPPPDFEPIAKVSPGQLLSSIIHVSGEPIDHERLEHGAQIPSIHAMAIVILQPLLGDWSITHGDKVQNLTPQLCGAAHVIRNSTPPQLVVLRLTCENKKKFSLFPIRLVDGIPVALLRTYSRMIE